MRRTKRLIMSAFVVAMIGSHVSAQEWPTRSVTVVNPYAAGSSADTLFRTIAARLAEQFGQPFVVENRTGGGGGIGTASVAKAAPDGYTFLYTATGPAVLNQLLYKSVPYDAARDFEPIILLSDAPQVIISDPKLGFRSLRDLIAFGKKNSGALNVGHAGAGSMGHLAAALFLSRSGISGSLVSYRGAAPVVRDVLSGHIHAGFPIYIKAVSTVTSLAVTSEQRAAFLPDVPTAKESGVDLVATTWLGFLAPAGTPKAIVAKVNQAINEYIKSDDGRRQFTNLGYLPLGGPPERLARIMAADKAKWAPVIASEKISLDN